MSSSGNIEIGVIEIDAGVDDGNANVHTLVNPVDIGDGAAEGIDAAYAGGDGLDHQEELNVRLDENDAGQFVQGFHWDIGAM